MDGTACPAAVADDPRCFHRSCPGTGRHFTGYQYSFTADFAAGTRKVVVIDNEAGDVHTISFVLAKPSLEGVELLTELNDFLAAMLQPPRKLGDRPYGQYREETP